MEKVPHWMKDHEESDSRQFQLAKERDDKMAEMLEKIEHRLDPEHENYILKKYTPILDAYNGFIFSKSFIMGLSAIIIAITSVGGAILYLFNHKL